MKKADFRAIILLFTFGHGCLGHPKSLEYFDPNSFFLLIWLIVDCWRTRLIDCERTRLIDCERTRLIDCGRTKLIDCGKTKLIDCGRTKLIDCVRTTVIDCESRFFSCGG